MGLVEEMTPVHKTTLKHLMTHFAKVYHHQCKLRRERPESNAVDRPATWSVVFSHILIRPPWEALTKVRAGVVADPSLLLKKTRRMKS